MSRCIESSMDDLTRTAIPQFGSYRTANSREVKTGNQRGWNGGCPGYFDCHLRPEDPFQGVSLQLLAGPIASRRVCFLPSNGEVHPCHEPGRTAFDWLLLFVGPERPGCASRRVCVDGTAGSRFPATILSATVGFEGDLAAPRRGQEDHLLEGRNLMRRTEASCVGVRIRGCRVAVTIAAVKSVRRSQRKESGGNVLSFSHVQSTLHLVAWRRPAEIESGRRLHGHRVALVPNRVLGRIDARPKLSNH